MPFRDIPRDVALRIPRVRALREHAVALAAERDAVAQDRDALRQRLETAESLIAAATAQEGELRLAIAITRAEIDAMLADREAAELKFQLLTSDHQRAVAANDELLTELGKAQTLLSERSWDASLLAEKEEVQLKLYDATSDLQRVNRYAEELSQKLIAAEDKLNAETRRLHALGAEMKQEVQRGAARQAEAVGRVAVAEGEIGRLRTQLSLREAELRDAGAWRAAWKAERVALTLEAELASQREKTALEQVRSLSADVERLAQADVQAREAAAEAATLRTQLALLEQEAERLRNEERRLQQARAEIDDTRARLAVLEHEASRGRTAEISLAKTREQLSLAEAELGLMRVAQTPDIASSRQLTDVRDRLSGRLELIGYDLHHIRRRLGGHEGSSDAARGFYLDLLEASLTGILTKDEFFDDAASEPERPSRGREWPHTTKTMIGTTRLRNLRHLIETILADEVAGDVMEAGVWRGGACIYMRGVLAAYGVTDRSVWVADSFSGRPPPNAKRYPADRSNSQQTNEAPAAPLEEVKQNFDQYDLLDEQVKFLPGWFKDTLPGSPIESLSLLRLDGDMYGSTIEALEVLYPRVSLGGFVIVDDYRLAPCRQAVSDYRAQHRITDIIQDVDGGVSYWRKSR